MGTDFEKEMKILQTLATDENEWDTVPTSASKIMNPLLKGGRRKTKNNNKNHKKINYKQMARTLKRKLGL